MAVLDMSFGAGASRYIDSRVLECSNGAEITIYFGPHDKVIGLTIEEKGE